MVFFVSDDGTLGIKCSASELETVLKLREEFPQLDLASAYEMYLDEKREEDEIAQIQQRAITTSAPSW